MRYIPHTKQDIRTMLEKIGVESVDELFEQIPEPLRFKGSLNLPEPMSEPELMAHLQELAQAAPAGGRASFLGAGAYCHHVSPTVDQILLRSEFYTAYTPYQPEVSQGTLQAIFEFQTLICRIFGAEIANASMYDGATAMAEAALMARRVTKKDRILVSSAVHPEYVETLRTYLHGLDGGDPQVEMVDIDERTGQTDLAKLDAALGAGAAAVVVGYPNFFGVVDVLDEVAQKAKRAGALTVSVTTEPYAFGLLTPPGLLGADICVGEGQSLGVPPSFGGPGVGLLAICDDRKLVRQMPGRLVGQTVDADKKVGYVLTLSTREQHIRREKATSNICTNHGLCALAVTVNLSLVGRAGFEETARICLARAEYLKRAVADLDAFELVFEGPTFNEFAVRYKKGKAVEALAKLSNDGFLAGVDLGLFDPARDDTFLVAVTECRSRKDIDSLIEAMKAL